MPFLRLQDDGGDTELIDDEEGGSSHIGFRGLRTPAWCSKLSSLEKASLVLVALLLLSVVVLGVLVGLKGAVSQAGKSSSSTETCLSSDCVKDSSAVLSMMDQSIDPCDDFYEYSCGAWLTKSQIPDGKTSQSIFAEVDERNKDILKTILESSVSNFTKSEALALKYYRSCMDRNETTEKLGATPLLDLITANGGWCLLPNTTYDDSSVCNSTDETPGNFTIMSLIQQVTSLTNPLFTIGINIDDRNSSRHIMSIRQAGFSTMSKTDLASDKFRAAYADYMKETAVLLGADPVEADERAKDVVDFQHRLSLKAADRVELRDPAKANHRMTWSDLQGLLNTSLNLDIHQLVRDTFFSDNITWDEAQVFLNEMGSSKEVIENVRALLFERGNMSELIVPTPEYIQEMTNIVAEYMSSENGRRILSDHFQWRVVLHNVRYLSREFYNSLLKFDSITSGTSGELPKWELCVSRTSSSFGYALGSLFVKKAFGSAARDEATVMINNIKDGFIANFPSLSWMSSITKDQAEIKARAIIDLIGYPDFIKNETELDEFYKNITIEEDTLFENHQNMDAYVFKETLTSLFTEPDRTTWSMTPQTVNAYYSPEENNIAFPAGILQNPFFSLSRLKVRNYGQIGVAVGHEITHGFDDEGSQYDAQGNLRKWMSNSSLAAFHKRSCCVARQYSKYKEGPDMVNGNLTLGENIADNGGLGATYRAYRQWVERNGEELRLPGLDLSTNQLLFLSFAQTWCSLRTPESSHRLISTDPHSPTRFRVIGTVSNSMEFAEAFKCPVGSKMNPVEKCHVW